MNNKEIRIGALLVLDTLFFLLEAIIGYSVQSLALIADSFHMLNDIISLIIALWAVRMKNSKPADGKYTYGWQRAEILGALINAVFLIALCFTIIMDAIQRFFQPAEITNPQLILVVGIAGLLSNGIGLVLFHEHGHSHSHGGGGADVHGHGHSHSHTDGGASGHSQHDVPSNGELESSIGLDENTPLIRNPIRSSPSEVFDYFPDNVVERYNTETSTIKAGDASEGAHTHDHSHNGDVATKGVATKKKKKSMNMEGVFLHVLGDALGNVGVIITALIIWKTDYWWRFYSDPVTSLVITLIIFNSALPLCRKSSKILLQATPPYIDSDQILQSILKLPLVNSVHDFHVWNLNEDILIASLHIELTPNCEVTLPGAPSAAPASQNGATNTNEAEDDSANTQIDRNLFLTVVAQVRDLLHKYGIHSVTIQPEFPSLKNQNSGSTPNDLEDSNAFGNTSKQNCLVDGFTNCDTQSCH
ncbi:ZRC1 [Candida theae]|uniref:ZRC1 n=1 Tax=Candida theae TaxID=1198502 RepID=A0AAD5BE29_9ASCO|nr:ZRC1 [Candida theae]KAI5957603.1 ZRC1 [Candida theae]